MAPLSVAACRLPHAAARMLPARRPGGAARRGDHRFRTRDHPADHSSLIITGTSRGVGAALAEQLLQPGHALLTMARHRHAGLQATADEVGVPLTQWTVDLAEPGAVAEA